VVLVENLEAFELYLLEGLALKKHILRTVSSSFVQPRITVYQIGLLLRVLLGYFLQLDCYSPSQ